MKPGESAEAVYRVEVNKDATIKTYSLDSEIRYNDALNNNYVSDTVKVIVDVQPADNTPTYLVALVGLLVVAGGGFWLYRRKQQNGRQGAVRRERILSPSGGAGRTNTGGIGRAVWCGILAGGFWSVHSLARSAVRVRGGFSGVNPRSMRRFWERMSSLRARISNWTLSSRIREWIPKSSGNWNIRPLR
ncbi:LPXTG cell wall anchor domain-containing protein [Methanogenium cariaci]|uniref:LPXTG cell wall anchor domain-containing protein n=1 Tax=Methanogenium cariaci TaxID=2197 RepID=UPI00158411A0|nr:LPXTG cell wall anchor domain-containing protein [Methanogenium cariaci]